MRRSRVLASACVLALLAGCSGGDDDGGGVGFTFPGDRGEGGTIPRVDPEAVGRSVGEVVVQAEDGTPLRLDRYEGTPLVLNLYATWCAPCREELPAFEQVHDEVGPGVAFLGVAVPPDLGGARAMAGDAGVTYDLAESPDGDIVVDLGAAVLPVTAFVDVDGRISELRSGGLDADELRDAIREHFGR